MNEIAIERSTNRLTPEPWHATPIDAVLCRVGSGSDGLSRVEHARRLAEVGANRLPQAASRGSLIRFLAPSSATSSFVRAIALDCTTVGDPVGMRHENARFG